MATQNRTRTTTTRTGTSKKGDSGTQLSEKAIALRQERLLKEQEQKKKMVYMIIGPGTVLIIIVLAIKFFMAGDASSSKKVVKKRSHAIAYSIPDGAKEGMKKALVMIDEATLLIRDGANAEDSNEKYAKAAETLSNAQEIIEDLSDKYPGEWADGELHRIQKLMYSTKKATTLNYY
jgi:hypothetical protein